MEFFSIFSVLGQALYHTWWIILPTSLFYLFKILYTDFALVTSVNSHFRTFNWIMLEIIPPKDIERGPKPMESIFNGISGVTSSPNTFSMWLRGGFIQDRFSLELVGAEGQAHFYIRLLKKHRSMIEAHVYAQYPDAEIVEVEDYVHKLPRIVPNKDWNLWGADFGLTLADPFPIKTYDKFEEDITGTMIDPLAASMEVIGTLPSNQYIWLQYVIEPLQEKWNKGEVYAKILDKLRGREKAPALGLLDHLWDVLKHVFGAMFAPPEFASAPKKEEQPLEFRLSPLEKDVLKAVEENLGRYTYKTKMRFILVGKRENFQKPLVSAFIGSIKQFNDMNYNLLKPDDLSKTYGRIFFVKEIEDYRKRKLYRRYRDRDPNGVKIFLSTKELATLYHFPDMGVKSPAVSRVASKMGTAPSNLPIR
jgi:hypothetical protein